MNTTATYLRALIAKHTEEATRLFAAGEYIRSHQESIRAWAAHDQLQKCL